MTVASFTARYDLRRPALASTPRHELYAAALDQAAYLDEHGFTSVALSEHHGVEDGYLPSPLVMGGAFAARTKTIGIIVAALLVPLHDPIRLAEDTLVLDHASAGRMAYVFGLGYRPEEYAMFGKAWDTRGADIERAVETVLRAWTNEPFEYQGRTVQVTPEPYTKPHPHAFYGGVSKAAARRAARLGLGFFPQVRDEALADCYREACRDLGRDPGFVMLPGTGPGTIFCAEDPDAFWNRYGEHLLYEARVYESWQGQNDSAVRDRSTTVEEMRKTGVYAVFTPDDLIARLQSGELQSVTTHPMCGGLPPDAAWESLRLLAEVVKPAVGD